MTSTSSISDFSEVKGSVSGSQKSLMECHGCGQIHNLPELESGYELNCGICGTHILSHRLNWRDKAAAFTLAGAVFFFLAISLPFLSVSAAGQNLGSGLITGVQALWKSQHHALSVIVLFTVILIPIARLSAMSWLLWLSFTQTKRRYALLLLKIVDMMNPWSMLEIFLLAVLVTVVKLGSMAELEAGMGLFCYALLVIMMIGASLNLNRQELWAEHHPHNYFVRDEGKASYLESDDLVEAEEHVSCHHCRALVVASLAHEPCPRCNSGLHKRTKGSIEKTVALLIASVILYIPANLMPIMSSTVLGVTKADTIMSGVVTLIMHGSWPVALVVFVASILVPVAKFILMFWLCWSVSHNSVTNQRQRTALYRVTEFVGRWSMVDVFVVTLLVALIQFGAFANVAPEPGALAFASVVMLTMLAAESFDSRLIWDAKQSEVEKDTKARDNKMGGEESDD